MTNAARHPILFNLRPWALSGDKDVAEIFRTRHASFVANLMVPLH